MIDLKRDDKGNLKIATGLNSQKYRCYEPGQEKDFKVSRSRFEDFSKCPRCFYLRMVQCLQQPEGPPFRLNELTDTLLKKEFDECRKNKRSHRKLIEKGLDHIIPFDAGTEILTNSKKEKQEWQIIDIWRDARSKGIKSRFKDTNIILQGGVDDVWFNTKTKELILVDYKSQASNEDVSQDTYFQKWHHDGYKTQLNFYAYIMKNMKLEFDISEDSYLYVVNGLEFEKGFMGQIQFSETLIHHKIKTDYLEDKIQKMIDTMNSTKIPEGHESCKNCAYARQRSVYDTLGDNNEK